MGDQHHGAKTTDKSVPEMTDALWKDILFQVNGTKPPVWYDFSAPFSVALMSAAVLVLCILMLLEPKAMPKICGIVTLAAYSLYAARYLINLVHSRQLRTRTAKLTATMLEVTCQAWTKQFAVKDIVFTMSYSSSTNLCIIAATETDYVTIRCSCGYLFAKNGKEMIAPFYALNKQFMQWNPNHINYVRSKRFKKKNLFKIPMFVFESEYDSPRVDKLVDSLREAYRFR